MLEVINNIMGWYDKTVNSMTITVFEFSGKISHGTKKL